MKLPIFALTAWAVLGLQQEVRANGDLCSSPAFRSAFVEGWATIDYSSMSVTLLSYGDAALPCFKRIVAGNTLGIPECAKDLHRCAAWAMGAAGRLGTPASRQYLRQYLRTGRNTRVLVTAIMSLGNLHASEARPELRKLLEHSDPEVRARSVLSLGVIGNRGDFDVLLAATLALPPEHLYTGAQGLVKLGDKRAIGPLEKRASALSDETARIALQSAIGQLREKVD